MVEFSLNVKEMRVGVERNFLVTLVRNADGTAVATYRLPEPVEHQKKVFVGPGWIQSLEKNAGHGKRLMEEVWKVFGAGAHLLGMKVYHHPWPYTTASMKWTDELGYKKVKGSLLLREKVFEPLPSASEEHREAAKIIFGGLLAPERKRG